MKTVDRILLYLDLQYDNQAVIERACLLANAYHSQVDVMTCVYNGSLEGDHILDQTGKERAHQSYCAGYKSQLEKMVKPLIDADVTTRIHIQWHKRPYEGILNASQQFDSNLILKATHHHSLLKRIMLSHNDWNLIQDADVPLWLVKPEHQFNCNNITAAIDPVNAHDKPDELDVRIVTTAEALSEKLEGTYNLFHCFDPVPANMMLDIDISAQSDISGAIHSRHQEAMDRFISEQSLDTKNCHLVQGDIAMSLPEHLAKQKSELLVLGAVKRGTLDRFLIGSTAERILEVVDSDILICK